MRIVNGWIEFEEQEQALWETLLERKLGAITPVLLRELGESRVRELVDDGYLIWARMAAQHINDIPCSHLQ
ncbi:hypothetical protein QN372_16985 [Undibacterium sp. RTI2.1]|uniref:hypothetical protein n=1 Tax=unclassified Undibacterium TaxID=2630295 RepID=UPI002AB53B76|nr:MULTISPECIES: hypothetical protein [unclassified Undibacterium]MDY7537875.1 hypothetical protein [Undibacterium sp. 5I1]MEB0032451.1 hypothetical protein [Undibacterium sp. RTI2.1]MEB0118599.1 hypothetical protein [Undibacterium sp. RTI2.2]MEB0232999.1 hypothetical protein [Undibacterium sp. 10I3]MEB0259765.1 hypothetical protein [Undibacterium sp. 5I1]